MRGTNKINNHRRDIEPENPNITMGKAGMVQGKKKAVINIIDPTTTVEIFPYCRIRLYCRDVLVFCPPQILGIGIGSNFNG